jgi:hypothetical protein
MPPVPSLLELAALLDDIVERVAALEAAVGDETARAETQAKKDAAREDDLAKLIWAAKHGRQRPW